MRKDLEVSGTRPFQNSTVKIFSLSNATSDDGEGLADSSHVDLTQDSLYVLSSALS